MKWRPLSLHRSLNPRRLRDPMLARLVGGWAMVVLLAAAAGLLGTGPEARFIALPTVLSICILFWLGWSWAALPMALMHGLLAWRSGMPSYAAAMASVAQPLGMTLYVLVYGSLKPSIDLRRPLPLLIFLAVSALATFVSSFISSIWAFQRHIESDVMRAQWLLWCAVQMMLAIAAAVVLALATPRVLRWRDRQKPGVLAIPDSLFQIAAGIAIAMLLTMCVMAATVMRAVQDFQTVMHAQYPSKLHGLLTSMIEGFWVDLARSGVILITFGAGFYFIAAAWTRALRERMRRASGDLSRARDFTRSILDGMEEGLAVYDIANESLVEINPAFCRLTGFTREELLGARPPFPYWDPDLPNGGSGRFSRQLAGDLKTEEVSLRTKEGRHFTAQVVPGAIREEGGKLRWLVATFRDVTARREAEAALQQSEARFRAVYEHSAHGLVVSDLHGVTIMANRSFQEMIGYSEDELRRMHFRKFSPPADAAEDERLALELIAGRRASYHMEKRYIHKNGTIVWAELTVTLTRNSAGEPLFAIGIVENITQRRQAIEALKESERRMREAIDRMPVMFDAFDEQGNIIVWNRECERVTGYGADEIVGNPDAMKLLYPDAETRERTQREMKARGHYYRDWERTLACKDGSRRHILWSNISRHVPLPGWGSWGIGVDVTERRRAEAERDRLFNLSIDMLCVAGFDGYLKQVNPAWSRALGKSEQEMLARPWSELVHPDDREATASAMDILRAGQPISNMENRYLTRDGEVRWISWNAFPLTGDSLIFGVARDITERKAAERALRESEQHFRMLIENVQDTITVLDETGNVMFVGPSIERVLGWTPAEMHGRNAFDLIHPDDLEGLRLIWSSGVREPGRVSRVEYRARHCDGSWRWLEGIGCNLLHEPAVRGVVINSRDVTGRRQVEEERAGLEAQLRQAQKMEAVGLLAGGVAHDFNNLLTPIIGYTELAQIKQREGGGLAQYADQILDAARQARNLTRQLLAFGRKQLLEVRPLDLSREVAQVQKILRRVLRENIELVLQLDDAPCMIKADPSQVQQVLMNLIVNAQDAMPAGGRLELRSRLVTGRPVEPDSRPPGVATAGEKELLEEAYVQLVVSDTGTGIPLEALEHVFEPFFTTKEREKGTGLGLAMVYGIVKQHGGTIQVMSQPGRGTTFDIRFPICGLEQDPLDFTPPAVLSAGGAETILVVEDEPMVRRLTVDILNSKGYTVLEAESPEEAFKLVQRELRPIHLLVSDVIMPGMNGREMHARLLQLRPNLKVLYLSGYTNDVLSGQGLSDDPLHFLQKPFSVDGLTAKVREALHAMAPCNLR